MPNSCLRTVARFASGLVRHESPRRPVNGSLRLLRIEKVAGLHRVDGYLQLRTRTETLRHNLLRFLLQCRADGKRVVGYGAPGKGNTLLNYCGIRSDLLEYIVDRNPYKHGRFTPGMRIPIHDPKRIAKDRPDVVLALPWNLEAELTDQLSYIAEWGGQLVFPLRPCTCDAIGIQRQWDVAAISVCRGLWRP